MTKRHKFALLISIITASIVILILAPMFLHENIMSFNELKVNTAPKFEVGQKFFYLTTNRTMSNGGFSYEEDVFTVNNIEEINGTRYYEVIRNYTYFSGNRDEYDLNETIVWTNSQVETFYYNAENGTCFMGNPDSSEFRNGDTYSDSIGFFVYWMLCLKEGLIWGIDNPDFPPELMMINHDARFEVLGQENMSGVMCFKVKLQTIVKGTVDETQYYWIDAERRIMIKHETSPGFYKYLVN